MAVPHDHIMVLAEMIEALDDKPPRTDEEIDEAVVHWREREREVKHTSALALDRSIRLINKEEIVLNMSMKSFRDKQRAMKKCGKKRGHGGSRKKGVSLLNDRLGVEVK